MVSALLNEPFFTGTSSVSDQVPALLPVALGGHQYLIDLKEYDRESVEVLRQQADQSDQPSERSFNPVALWRRSVESWHHGAGQTNYDLTDSDPARFRSSKGVDIWTPGQVSLLPDTDQKRTSANTNVRVQVAGTRIYAIDGQTLLYTTDIAAGTPTWTTVTGTPAETATSLTSDGFRVWAAYPSGPYETNTGVSTASALGTQDVDLVSYGNGRLVGSHDDVLYELDAAGVATSLFDHPNDAFRWDVIATAPNAIYAAGHAGTNGEVYRITVTDTDTALDKVTSCASLPDGEYVTAILSYVGVVVLGTSKGVRIAQADDAGNLTYGPLVASTTAPVYALEGEDRYVWFGWTAYDATSTGLGRLDLAAFTATLRPAYATDLMVTGSGAVLSAATFGGLRVLTVSGSGIWAQDTTKVASGTIESGLIRWGTTERKIVARADMRIEPLPAGGTVTMSVAYDDGSYDTVATLEGEGVTGPTTALSTRETGTEQAEVRLTLTRATVTTLGPVVLRHTIKALIAPARSERILIPILLHEHVQSGNDEDGRLIAFDTAAEFRFLKQLESNGVPTTYQEGNESWTVTVQRVRMRPTSWTYGRAWLQGTCFVTVESIEG